MPFKRLVTSDGIRRPRLYDPCLKLCYPLSILAKDRNFYLISLENRQKNERIQFDKFIADNDLGVFKMSWSTLVEEN